MPWKQKWLWESGQSLKWDLTAAATGAPGAATKNKEKKKNHHFLSRGGGGGIYRVVLGLDVFILGSPAAMRSDSRILAGDHPKRTQRGLHSKQRRK